MTALAFANTTEQVIENTEKTGFSLTSFFGKLAKAPAMAKSVGVALKKETVLSFDSLFRKDRLDAEAITAQHAKLKDMAAHAGIMMLAKSLVAFTIGTGSIVPIAATVAVSTAAMSAYKIAQQALKDRKAGDNSFWGSVKESFTSGAAVSTLKSQFARAAIGGAIGFGLHELISNINIDFSKIFAGLIGTAHAATLDNMGTIIGTTDTLDQVRQHLETTGRMSRGARIDLAGAINGNAQDTKDMAWRLYNGIGVTKNDELAFKLYDRAAALGNVQAQRDLAYLARTGVYDPQGWEATAELNRAENAKHLAFQAAQGNVAETALADPAPRLEVDPSVLADDTVIAPQEPVIVAAPRIEPDLTGILSDETVTSGAAAQAEITTSEPESILPEGFGENPAQAQAEAPAVIGTTDPAASVTEADAQPAVVYNDIARCTAEPASTTTRLGRLVRAFTFNCTTPTTEMAQPNDSVIVQLKDKATRFFLPGTQPVNAQSWITRDVLPAFTLANRDVAIAAIESQQQAALSSAGGPTAGGLR